MILQTIITFKSNTDKFEVRKENDMFKDKNVVLGVCGGIAAYKIASLASALAKQGANVFVIMTKNATNFITPTTFETLTSNKCIVDTFDRNFNFEVEHIALAKKADVVLIAPATANVIGKISNIKSGLKNQPTPTLDKEPNFFITTNYTVIKSILYIGTQSLFL